MKHTFYKIAVCAFLLTLAILSLSACDFSNLICLHQWSNAEIITEATCEKGGLGKTTCLKCGKVSEGEIPAKGHTEGEWITERVANCGESGLRYTECTACKIKMNTEVLPAVGAHVYEGDNCSVCGFTNEKYFEFVYISSTDSYEIRANANYTLPSDLVLPSEYDGKPVTVVGENGFSNSDSIVNLTIGRNVTRINSVAFIYCDNIATLTLPEGVEYIGAQAFSFCYGLTELTIPDSVTTFGEGAFLGCTNLVSVSVGEGAALRSTVFGRCSSLVSINIKESNPYCRTIDGSVYSKDGTVLIQYAIGRKNSRFEIPDGVTTISDYSFENCVNLTSIVVPDSVTLIRSAAFYYCSELTDITIGSGVTSIQIGAFIGCSSLESVVMKDTDGWRVSKESDGSYPSTVSSYELSDPARAAELFRETYSTHYWFKK